MSARGGSAILCDGLVKIYRVAEREVVALQGLELEVRGGEVLGIVGPSGSGKSTLLNVVGGLDRPSAGRLLVDGVALAGLPDAALDHYRRERVGFVWQLPGRNLVPHLSAQENVALPMVLAMMPAPARRERAAELLVAVGLEARAAHLPAHLSGGEQQRLAIAVALANRPRLLLADEPTGELDSATAGEIYALFRALNERYGLTVVIVSHDPAVARVVDRVVTIRDGRTSTETRQVGRPVPRAGEEEATEEEVGMEELVVMDSTGRLQVPEEMREEYGLAGRVRLERTPDGVLIRPQDAEEWDGG